jgi:SprT protein
MQVPFEQVRDKAYLMVKELSAEAFRIYGVKLVPTLDFSIRGRSTCGKATYMDNKIKINAQIACLNFSDFEDTMIHEFSHLLDYKVYKKWGHGPTWKSIMVALGGNPTYAAKGLNMEGISSARTVKKFLYKCRCKHYELTSIRHNKISLGAKYTCRLCNGTLFLVKS